VSVSVAQLFEGTEKKVELVLSPGNPSLRSHDARFWNGVCEAAGARILFRQCGDRCDAYLLSESSLFVYDDKMIMITCGRTRLVAAVEAVLRVVPASAVEFLVYERKNESFPHAQPTSFFDDVRCLRRYFTGTALRFGDADDHHIHLFTLDRKHAPDAGEITLELLMHGIDERIAELFRPGDDVAEVRRQSGLDRLLPGFAINDHLFEPSGYSLNGLCGEAYWTLHVTPQPAGSYVSFETNYRDRDQLHAGVDRLLDLFRPRSFDWLLFDLDDTLHLAPSGYRLRDLFSTRLTCGYRVDFATHDRPPSGARLPAELHVDA